MTRVSLGPGQQVEIEGDVTPAALARIAKGLWDYIAPPDDDEPPSPGPGFGFHTELRHPPDMHPNDLDGNTPLP